MHGKRKWLPGWQRVELVELCLDRGASRRQAAAWRRVSVATVQYWVERYRAASEQERASGAWAQDRSCRPHHQPARVSDEVHDRVCEVRTRTGWGPRLIASELGMAHATVSRCLARRGLSRMPAPDREHVRRFEWPCPGDLLQIDTKRLARFSRPGHKLTGDRYRTGAEKRMRVGWEFCHSLDHRRSHSTGLHRDPPRRAGRDRHRLCRARAVVLRRPRHHRQATANRQRLDLHPQPLPARTAHRARHRAPPDPTANAQAQRQDRALPTDSRARMGLRTALPQLTRPRGSAPDLAQPLQPAPQPQLARQPATHQPRSERPQAQQLERATCSLGSPTASRMTSAV